MTPQAVTFDAGGTLIEVAEPVGATYTRLAAAHGIVVAPAAVEAGFRSAFAAAPALAFPGLDAPHRIERERGWWRAVVHAALGSAADSPRFEECFDALFDHYAQAAAWRVFPDVRPVLGQLRAAGLRVGVVSNFDSRLPGILADLGIAPLVGAIVHSSAAGYAKPAPGIVRAAATVLGVRLPDLLHVGDAPEDLVAARAAGAAALLIDRCASPRAAAPTTDTIASLAELPAWLGLVGRSPAQP